MNTVRIPARGMTCANCARSVEKTLASVPGVAKVSVDLAAGTATVDYDTGLVAPEVLSNAVRDLGYEVPE